ncbi:Rho GTPase activation protein [Phycomyces blakesleeanus]|uniref:Rho-GAP domain-containing protein n=2 Tax=Phycomyces blakesleeanus TaxID=4837 RepID=A0A167MIX2_PHYB8|nr:hypothetical protein PHYBLDRAFT_169219 [Phycomyces blakesleeanus NRRL 1555(-)]OAD72959.1 hypothetical protein PHYBLDRAFT_169219 [Phycomyces blakesleeanus NRRL 1555(-)]|eukprot:XP_018290999.1 hypothetical protein PHYBLDRAFT_169219 [Phycomyces blakesleeanus NRRL 1555(-)]
MNGKSHRNPLSFLLKRKNGLWFNYKDTKKGPLNGIFGAPLEHGAQCGSMTSQGLYVPTIVHRCFTEIMNRGLLVEGIFRLSGAASEVDSLELEFDRPPTYGKYLDLTHYDIHAITGVVKKYLRSLPNPVIPSAYHSRFLHYADNRNKNIQSLYRLIEELPTANYQLLHYIMILVSSIQNSSHVNKMNAEALAIVLTPVCSGLEQTLKKNSIKRNTRPRMENMQNLVQTNARWTHVWNLMITNHAALLLAWNTHSRLGTKTLPALSTHTHTHTPSPAGHSDISQHKILQLALFPEEDTLDWCLNHSLISFPDQQTSPPPNLPLLPQTEQEQRYGVVVMRRNNTGYKGGGRQRLRQRMEATSDTPKDYLETLFLDLSTDTITKPLTSSQPIPCHSDSNESSRANSSTSLNQVLA